MTPNNRYGEAGMTKERGRDWRKLRLLIRAFLVVFALMVTECFYLTDPVH